MKPNLIDKIIQFFKGIFKRKKPKKKRKKRASKGVNNLVIPKGLLEINKPLFKGFDKYKFYKELRKKYPKNYKTIWRMMALETRHFKSGQFTHTGTGGMEVHRENYPYGWTVGKKLWESDKLAPFGYKVFTDAANRTRAFLAFKSPLSFAAVFDAYINKYRAGRWRSTNLDKQRSYEATLKKIKLPKI